MNKKDLMHITSALVMGDGGVYYSGKDCRYIRNMISDHKDYMEWQVDVLSNISSTSLTTYKPMRSDQKPGLRVMTHSHPKFTVIRKRVYIDKYKSVDPHYLKGLDWQMAAILYMDDGSMAWERRCNPPKPDVRLNTKRLSYGDSVLLKKAFRDRLGVEFNVNRHYDKWFLRLRSKDVYKFLDGVEPYIFPSFRYKLPYSKSVAPLQIPE